MTGSPTPGRSLPASAGRLETADPLALAAMLAAKDRRALARAITLIESIRADDRRAAETLLDHLLPRTGNAVRIGISGAPGVGKSTLIEALGLRLLARGHFLAVLAVDPTSPVSGGSILGDKTRMERLAREPNAFIRPSPSGGSAGGAARRTREAVLACEAAGFDWVIVETVGVGQTEIAIRDLVDVVVLVLAPGGGDELQGIKRGLMELADLVVVNKTDGDLAPAAERARGHVEAALRLVRPGGGAPAVVPCSALEGTGLDAVLAQMTDRFEENRRSGALRDRRRAQALAWMWTEIGDLLRVELGRHPKARRMAERQEDAVAHDRTTPTRAARRVLAAFLGHDEGDEDPDAIPP